MGIFYTPTLFAVTESLSVPANNIYTASFSFNLAPFVSRKHIVPDRVFFNASGTPQEFPTSTTPQSFSQWHTTYHPATWQDPWKSADLAAASTFSYPQILQLPQALTANLPSRTVLIAAMNLASSFDISLRAYTNEANLLTSPAAGFPMIISSPGILKPFSMLYSDGKVFFFYVNFSDSRIHMKTYDGNVLSEKAFSNSDLNVAFGVAGCTFLHNNEEYIALTYAKSSSEVSIVTFKPEEFPSTATFTIDIGTFGSLSVPITHNPRTGDFILSWMDPTGEGRYCSGSMSSPGNFSFGSVNAFGSFERTYSNSVLSLNNFENSLVLPSKAAANKMSSYFLHGSNPPTLAKDFTTTGYTAQFPYVSNGMHYLGLLRLTSFKTFNLHRRPLPFPTNNWWQTENKTLHIEGPPQLNSQVTIEVDFANVNATESTAKTVNAGTVGGFRSLTSGYRVIRDASNQFRIKFDKNMRVASYAEIIGTNTPIRLLDAANNPVSIVHDGGTSNEIYFKPVANLDFNTTYTITIASDVIDANGSQIYEDRQINFVTQTTSSQVAADEVASISLHTSSSYDAVSRLNSGDEINASATIYIAVETAVDPAFNTIDTTAVSIYLNGSATPQGSVTLTETAANSKTFRGSYTVSTPTGGNHIFRFQTIKNDVYLDLSCGFPTISSVSPAAAAIGTLINNQPQIVFSENIKNSTVNASNIKLTRSGTLAGYSVSGSGNSITIDPDDTIEGLLRTETQYQIEAGYGITDLAGNPFVNVPATFTSTFTTQASQTQPISVNAVKLYSDAALTSQLAADADYYGTGTVYIKFEASDGQALTRDSTTAMLSTGQTAILTETASSTGIFVGQSSFSGLTHNFQLKVSSTVTPSASAALKITWPGLTPSAPASGAVNVPLNSALRIQADEALNSALVNAGNIITRQNGGIVGTNVSYNGVLKEISIVPTALLESEKTYTVEVLNQTDLFGNPQRSPLLYSFTTEDKTPPTLMSFYPANAAAGVTIDQQPYFTFSENILAASVSKTSVKLTRGGVLASYTLVVSGNRITIDPDDSPDSWLRTATVYSIELNNGIRDLAGNGLANVPEPFQMSFSTQASVTPPADLTNISLYKDPLLITSWGNAESIPASATVHIKMTGTDGATQTRDLASVTLQTGWGNSYEFAVQESASNSSGIYIGSFSFDSIPLYGVPTPLPTASSGELIFRATQKPATVAALSVAFPELYGSETTVTTTSGTTTASGARSVRVDSAVGLTFSESLASAGSSAALNISSGGVPVVVARSLSADGKRITLTPSAPLSFGSEFLVSAVYSDAGLKSTVGNPLFRPFTFKFTTQAAQTQPTNVSSINLYPTADMSPLNIYTSGQDFNATGTLYIEAIGEDGAANTVDATSVTVSTGNTVILTETAANSGIYRGSLAYGNLSDGFVMKAISSVSPAASQSLTLSFPQLSSSLPASGATGVSFATPIRVQASEELDSTTVNSGNVKLSHNGTEVAGTVSYLAAQRLIEFIPAQNLEFSKTHVLNIANIKDLAGNPVQTPFTMSFTVQSTSVPPTVISTIKTFSDSNYQNQLAAGSLIAPSADIFIEITAGDLSATTIDTTEVSLSTNVSANSRTATLLETAINSGIFQGMITVFADEDATLTFYSTTTPAVRTTLKTFKMPKFTSLAPASGTANLFLDSVFSIEGSKPFDAATINKNNITLTGNSGPASFSLTQPAANQLSLKTSLKPSENLFFRLTSAIKDTDGLPYPELIASYSTLTPTIKELRLYDDAAMTQPLADLAEVEMGKTVYLSIIASNAYLNEPETATATWSDETATFSISLTEASPGEFNGSLTVPQSPEKLLTVAPESRPDLIRYLRITRGFALESFSPASGAVNVPADVWPSWNFTRPVEPTDLSAGNFSLIRISDNTTVPVTIRRSLSGMQVRLEPAGVLPLLTVFEMRLNGSVRDTSGNALGASLATRFSTQPPPPPPTEIISLRNYETSAYATPTLAIANDDSLYLEMVARDTSFSTYETARVRVESSDSSLDGLELTLVEIAPPSGVYRLALPINLPVGTTIKIQSQASPGMVINLTAYLRTRLLGISPASGSTGLYLDQPFSFNFSAAITSSTLASGLQIFSAGGQQIPADFSVSNAGKTVTFTPQTAFATGSSHQIIINTSLRDANGLFLLPETALFSTRGETAASFELLTGLAPLAGQKVSLTGEAVRGAIGILASTTEMLANASETRIFRFSAGSQVLDVTLQETTPGSFAGNSDLAAFSGSSLQGSLLFAGNPTSSFALASEPEIVTVTPASGSSGVDEVVQPAATFSRKMFYDSGDGALRIESAAGTINTVQHGPATDSMVLNWRLTAPLPVEASCTLRLSGLTDYLGQPLADYQHTFSTGGRQGINLYSENSFAQLITSETINMPIIFCEIAASGTLYLSGRSFFLEAKRGTRATETLRLPVEPASTTSGLYRCSLAISESRAIPQHSLQLFPGEWLEITSPELTSDKKLLYYRNAGSTTPTQINDLRFFADRHYARRIYDKLESPALFIEIDAEDQNWFTVDKTAVKVTSDADPVGFDLNLVETAAHSNIFRAAIRLNSLRSDPAAGNLKVAPGQRIRVVSLADSSVQGSIRYVPENSIKNIAVYPSPARGDTVTFRFYLNFASDVHLEIYDTAGDKIKGFVIRAREGDNDFRWRLPSHLANGVYFYRMEIDKDPQTPAGKRKGRGKFAVLR